MSKGKTDSKGPIIVARIVLIGVLILAFAGPVILKCLEGACPWVPVSDSILKVVPPPPVNFLPDHSDIGYDLAFIEGLTASNSEIAKIFVEQGRGEYDDLLDMLDHEFGRGDNFGHSYDAPDKCEPNADINWLMMQVILMKDDKGACDYIDYLRSNPYYKISYQFDEVGEYGYVNWAHRSDEDEGECEEMVVQLRYQKYNAMISLQMGLNEDTISHEGVKAIAIPLMRIIEQKLDAAAR